jgi:transposase
MRIAIEASTHSPWVSSLLKDAGHEVIVANPRKLRMIFQSDCKNDRFDASQLARVARLDPKLLYPVEHRRHQARVDQGIIKSQRKPGARTNAIGEPCAQHHQILWRALGRLWAHHLRQACSPANSAGTTLSSDAGLANDRAPQR